MHFGSLCNAGRKIWIFYMNNMPSPKYVFGYAAVATKHKFKEKSKVKREKKWILPMVLMPTDTDLLCDYASMVFFLFRLKKQISRKKCIVDRRQADTLHTSSWDFEFRLKIAIWSDEISLSDLSAYILNIQNLNFNQLIYMNLICVWIVHFGEYE